MVSRKLEAPTAAHWAAVKQILRYFTGTLNHEGCHRVILRGRVHGGGNQSQPSVWLCRLFGELTGDTPTRAKLRINNKSVIALSKNPVHHDKNGEVEVDHVNTDGQLADFLTKALGRIKFVEMR
nr:uncharacterized protein LOC109746350 [Aegilops tauschii subsp. strangulata]